MAQWNKDTQSYRSQDTTNFEVMMLGDHWGEQADFRPSFSSKNRLKTSPYQTVFFNTFQYGKETDIWDEQVTGGGAAVHNVDASNITLSVGSTAGDKVVRQTRAVMGYIPGRTSTLSFAIRLEAPAEGVRRRFGIFDDNNGAYFEDNGGVYSYVIRSKTSGSVVETRVLRDDWNGDKLDGEGFSQHTADPTKQQMINIEYEWYGAGQVKFSWVIGGETITSHTFSHANTIDKVWSSTPFLPIRLELENVTGAAGTHYVYQGSNSLISEGEPEKLGILVSQATGTAGRTMSSSDTYYPILSIRLKSNNLTGIVLPRSLQVATNDNTNVFWKLVRNATLTGASWQAHDDPDSFMEYDLSATAMTGGRNVLNGFTIGGGSSLTDIDDNAALQLGRSNLGTVSDIYTLACASPNTNKHALAVLNWIEQR